MLKTIFLIFSIFYILENTIIFAKPASITYETKKIEEQKIIIDLSKLNITYKELKELLTLMNGKQIPSIPGGKDNITQLVPAIPENAESSNPPSSQTPSLNPSDGPKPEVNPSSEVGQSNVNGQTEKPSEIVTSTDNLEDNSSEVTTELPVNTQPENSSRIPPHSEITNRPPTNYPIESSTSSTDSKGPYLCNSEIDSVENIIKICGNKNKVVQIEGLDK